MKCPARPPGGRYFQPTTRKTCAPTCRCGLTFPDRPTVSSSGKIQVFKAGTNGSPVAVVDLAVANVNETVAGTMLRLPRPVHVAGNTVIVRLPVRLAYGESYYVTVDAGAIRSAAGMPMAFSGPDAWQFQTRAAPPSDRSALHVAVDGTGEFCSVQGALDALPASGAGRATIEIGPGVYYEVVRASGKNNLMLRGANRKRTLIVGENNDMTNAGTAKRALVNFENTSGLIIENLGIHNLTPQGGSQAEALRLQGCERCIVRHADIMSLQDTLLWSGRIYATDCYIAGNVDFVWGTGTVYFDRSEIKTVGRTGYVVQSRNGAGAFGYVFVDSKITADRGVSNIVLARIDASVYPASHVAYVNCQMGSHIAPAGWTVTGSSGGSLRFGEYQSTDASGAKLDVSRRHAASKQLSAEQAMQMRDPAYVLGGWMPEP